jgi:glycosyltransferase involved in cell wall biosynthesis
MAAIQETSMPNYLPLVSVLVASYNNEAYIEQTLDSIASQTHKNLEIIIVDDCSKDNSVQLIKDWIIRNSVKATLLKNEVNLGICKTFNKALAQANGKYVSIIGSDDLMLGDKLANQVSILEDAPAKVGAVYSDAFLIGPQAELYFGRFIQWHKHFFDIPQHDIFEILLKGNFIPVMSILWKKECFDVCGNFDEELIYEDYDMLLRVSAQYDIIFSDRISVQYRVHPANMHSKLQSLPAVETNFRIFYKLIGVREGKYDNLIKGSLDYYLLKLYELKSPKLREYYSKYKMHFNAGRVMDLALTTGLPYYRMAKLSRIFKGKASN